MKVHTDANTRKKDSNLTIKIRPKLVKRKVAVVQQEQKVSKDGRKVSKVKVKDIQKRTVTDLDEPLSGTWNCEVSVP